MMAWKVYRRRVWMVFSALIVIVMIVLCSACQKKTTPSVTHPTSLTQSHVDILTPESSNDIDPNAPLNTWDNVTHSIVEQMQSQGFSKNNISRSMSSNLSEQVKKLKKIVSNVSTSTEKNSHILLFSPALDEDSPRSAAIRHRYGDLVTSTATIADNSDDDNTDIPDTLVEQLRKAQKAGITVVLMGQKIPNFAENYYVSFSTAQSVARIQTENLVKKLQLNKATAQNPQAIEMLLPMNVGKEFNEQAFAASWKILKPYFVTGVAYSPSGLLDAHTTAQDWRNVAVSDDSESSISDALQARLSSSQNTNAHIDGIIAFNDYAAHHVIRALKNMGYTGSSATINPDITLESIVKTLAGDADVNKQRVPMPTSPEDEETDTTGSDKSSATKKTSLTWPIITSFGVYINDIPHIITGKLWTSSMEDRADISESVALLCAQIAQGRTGARLERSIPNVRSTTLTTALFAVSADNLKKTLIDTSYITPADAGL